MAGKCVRFMAGVPVFINLTCPGHRLCGCIHKPGTLMQSVLKYKLSLDSPLLLVWSAVALALMAALFHESFLWMADQWFNTEEYSHGVMIPAVAAYLAWQRRARLVHDTQSANVFGLGLMVLALGMFVIADLATIYVGVLLSFLLCFYGLVWMTLGWRNTRELLAPLFILVFMVPLPAFINNNLSAELQLISSQLGVAFIRLFDISVYLEGNVIDLGSYKLQVVDACSGLRYLYPLVALGFILAYLCEIPLWKRAILFLSTIPITVIMNSIRIGAIGVSVEYWGPEMAEGLLHDIEGWFMFMASLAVLIAELIILLRITGDRRRLGEVFVMDDAPADKDAHATPGGGLPVIFPAAGLVAVVVALIFSLGSGEEEEIVPERVSLNHFPLLVGDWYGTPDALESVYIEELKFDDYMMANYRKGNEHLNFYIAYYGSQKKGESAHSPRSCIPGGGWQITSIEGHHLGELYLNSQPLMANRAVIQKGEHRQVVYYWFQQRGRIITNEYLVKWYLFWDALTMNRSDGALVRLTVPLARNQPLTTADAAAADFMAQVQHRLNDFIPE